MLKKLAIKNFAVVDDLQVELSEGLNIFTGETGAGKSILIEALGFALGSRATLDYVRPGEARMEVTAVFSADLPDKKLSQRYSISDGCITLKRELDSKGRGRAFLDSKPLPISALSDFGELLVDFHGQHEHQTLLKPSMHMELLDRFGGLEREVAEVCEMFRQRQSIAAKLESVKLSEEEKARLLDLYGFQFNEIEKAEIKPGEDEDLEIKLPRMKNSGKVRALAEEAHRLLYSCEGAATESIGKALKSLEELVSLDESASGILELANHAAVSVDEASGSLSAYKESVDLDPEQLEIALKRQDTLSNLKKKYGPSLKDVLESGESLRIKISDLEGAREKEDDLAAALKKADSALRSLCEKLHAKRMAAAEKLSALVLKEIKPLGFPNVRFSVSVEMEEGRFGESGADSVEFLFSSNPGQPMRPLRHIASGGEMSRVMLGLKTILASADKIPVLVFDEVDAGVGAVVGMLVGEKLSGLASSKRQILCVTHLPQVACFADAHFHVSKESKDNATFVKLEKLDGKARVGELAKMLGGRRESSALSLKHAEELLKECGGKREKN